MSWLDYRPIPRYPVPSAREWLEAQEWATAYSDDFTPREQAATEDKCESCPHDFHGQPCEKYAIAVGQTTLSTRCTCRGPFAEEDK